MGKRKSSSKPMGPKRSDPLPTTFACLFCNHENSVTVKLNKKAGVGQLDCRVCGQKFQCAVNYLSAAVDVYGEWVDAAEEVAKENEVEADYAGTSRATDSGRAAGGRTTVDDYDDDDRRSYGGADDDEY